MFLLERHVFFLMALCLETVSSDDSCPGGYTEGATVTKGSYWYQCKQGQLVAGGCLVDGTNSRIDIGETFISGQYVMKCVLDSNKQLTLNYKSCVQDGKAHDVGDQWDDGSSWYKCSSEGQFPKVVTAGCLDGGQRVALKDRVAKDGIVYVCEKNSAGVPTMTPGGCVGGDGRQHAVGDKFDSDGKVYSCTANTKTTFVEVVGCLHKQTRLSSNDRVTEDDSIFVCNVDGDKSGLKPYACIGVEDGQKNEKKPGCFWFEGQEPYLYQMTCQEGSDKAKKVKTKCVYKVPGGSFTVEPGCYTKSGSITVGCQRNGDDIQTVLTDQGLSKC